MSLADSGNEEGQIGTFDRDPPIGSIRPKGIRRKRSNVWERRLADVTDRGLGRLNWADSARRPNGGNGRASGLSSTDR